MNQVTETASKYKWKTKTKIKHCILHFHGVSQPDTVPAHVCSLNLDFSVSRNYDFYKLLLQARLQCFHITYDWSRVIFSVFLVFGATFLGKCTIRNLGFFDVLLLKAKFEKNFAGLKENDQKLPYSQNLNDI